jgi:hypothetical protein
MSIAIFKPLEAAGEEGETVWGKLKQKIVSEAELAEHTAAGWVTEASEAMKAAELAKLEKENAALEAQIAAEQTKLDGRTKAAKELKAKLTPAPAEPEAPAEPVVPGA